MLQNFFSKHCDRSGKLLDVKSKPIAFQTLRKTQIYLRSILAPTLR